MLSRIENDSVSPSAATIKSLAKALNIPISQLLGEHRERADCSFVKAGSGVRNVAAQSPVIAMISSGIRLVGQLSSSPF
jgi:transcriptional regulator with XRE-family HTH domain